MVKRRQVILISALISGSSGCAYSLKDLETTCGETFTIENRTDRELNIAFEIEASSVSEIERSITLDAGDEKGYCDIIEGGRPVKISVDTNAHSETTKVYEEYQGGYEITVKIFENDIEFSAMLV